MTWGEETGSGGRPDNIAAIGPHTCSQWRTYQSLPHFTVWMDEETMANVEGWVNHGEGGHVCEHRAHRAEKQAD